MKHIISSKYHQLCKIFSFQNVPVQANGFKHENPMRLNVSIHSAVCTRCPNKTFFFSFYR